MECSVSGGSRKRARQPYWALIRAQVWVKILAAEIIRHLTLENMETETSKSRARWRAELGRGRRAMSGTAWLC